MEIWAEARQMRHTCGNSRDSLLPTGGAFLSAPAAHLQQQQAGRQTPHQHHVGPGPAHNLLQAAHGENVPSGGAGLQRLRPETTHGVQNGLRRDNTGEPRAQHTAPGRFCSGFLAWFCWTVQQEKGTPQASTLGLVSEHRK